MLDPYPVEEASDPLPQISERLTPWEPHAPGIVPEPPFEPRVAPGTGIQSHPLPESVGEFDELWCDLYLEAPLLRDQLGQLPCSTQGRGVDEIDLVIRQGPDQLSGLGTAALVHRDISPPLEEAEPVPIGLAMSDEDDRWHPTLTHSSIPGCAPIPWSW